ncbi:hypothetical protein Mal64_35910 [Pseudobythopirellula maris]|uniref:Uncharacterized protein n=1 Tax=Pseudobythopirellula maris TaxID=2527991 RepID=A0A5C5ZIX0_9BACT|nr:hypothetical protein [Pseudobythopirellula maris]TWT86761.1 hypothetical protein Mal64_35910 [Pseudobythopirellula maris]
MDTPGSQLDLASGGSTPGRAAHGAEGQNPFVGVHFTCCDIYARVYRNHKQDAYAGNCPKCAKPIRLKIGAGGTSSRFFTAS